MEEKIIIDGVDVSKCCCYENGKCLWTKRYYENNIVADCEKVKDCYYKQLKRLEQENEELSKLIRGTKDYAEVCSVCKDEVTIYPNISGRTNYTQNEVECLTLAQIISRKNNLEQKNEELKEQFEIETLKNNDTNECIYRSNLLNKYKHALEEIMGIANQTIIDYTDIAKNNEKLKALDLRNRMSNIQKIIYKAVRE